MSTAVTDRAQQVIEGFREAFFGRHDAEAAAQVYTEDATLWDPTTPETIRGRAAIEANLAAYLTAFPDLDADVTNVISAGEWFVAELTLHGTNTGPLEVEPGVTVPPTGKPVQMKVCWVGRATASGLCAEDRSYYDAASLLAQLGLSGE